MAWIRIEQSLVQNRKLYSLRSALRIDTAKAVGTLALLWLWAIDNARGGSLGRISDRQLAEICQFSPRRAAELRDALVSSGFLDPAGDDLVIHDWDDFGGRLEKRRERDRSYQRGRRRADVGADSASGRDTEQNTADQNRPDKTIADQMRQDNITFSGGDGGGARAESDDDFDEAGDYLLSRGLIPESWFGQAPELAANVRRFADSLFERIWGRAPGPTDYGRVFNCIVDREREDGAQHCRLNEKRRNLLMYAFEAAAAAGHTGEWDYVYGVLRRLAVRGIADLGDAEEYEMENGR